MLQTEMATSSRSTFLVLGRPVIAQLLRLYDYPDPRRLGRIIRGYDKSHALRTARLCTAVARDLGYTDDRVRHFQIACLLHDLGRAGLDRDLFGRIWSWAKANHIPTRPAEWRKRFRSTPYGKETEAFLARFTPQLERQGIPVDDWTSQQIEMRLGFARRLRRQLRRVQPQLSQLGIRWRPWMETIMLSYYYPERLSRMPHWVRQLGEILVGCEQLEAYSNRQRGKDYYVRSQEQFVEAFSFLDALRGKRILSEPVVASIRRLAAAGVFDNILESARGARLSTKDHAFLRSLEP